MQGTHYDHNFDFLGEKMKKRKVIRIAWFGEKIDQKKSQIFLPPPKKNIFFRRKNEKIGKKTDQKKFHKILPLPLPDITLEGLGEMFEGYSAEKYTGKIPLLPLGGRLEGPACRHRSKDPHRR